MPGSRPSGASHWDSVYRRTDPGGLGWFEPVPSTLELVLKYAQPDEGLIDVGGGVSRLTAELLDCGFTDLTVLDVSEAALSVAQHELGPRSSDVHWLQADVTRFEPDRTWKCWHDRAVYHFLIERRARLAYQRSAAAAVAAGGLLVIAAFAPDGPDTCAGLPVRRYDQLALAAEFADDFELIDGASRLPTSSSGDQRPYVAAVLRRRDRTPVRR